MNEGIFKKGVFEKIIKNRVKLSIAAGIIGIVLIYASSFVSSSDKQETNENLSASTITSAEYCEQLEQKVAKIVTGITGGKKPVVVITLDTGVQYVYADNTKQETAKTEEPDKTENSGVSEQNYIIVKNADGQEQPLIITEYMPSVRGVAIVCEGGYDSLLSEKIKNAVMSALNITSKKIYVTGK